jgi:radical SAM superfamily enzyme YgiQ (UPF0313 family)
LLERVAEWNRTRPAGKVRFSTQASVDLARDADLLQACGDAGLSTIFVGIETPNQESLAETHKRQNLRVNLTDEVTKIVQAGIMVTCGIVVGFDHDDTSIFERQAAFIESLPVPAIVFSVLVAPEATPLHARMQKEGRLVSHGRVGAGGFLKPNFMPKMMSATELEQGSAWLLNRVYAPDAYARRLRAFVDACPVSPGMAGPPRFGPLEMAIGAKLAQYGAGELRLVRLIEELFAKRADLRPQLSYQLAFYSQVRFMIARHGLWNPDPAAARASDRVSA